MSADIKTTIDKTVGYIVKNGPSFEKRLKENNKNGKFDFLNEDNEYHTYYKQQLQQRMANNEESETKAMSGDEPVEQVDEPRPLHFLPKLPLISSRDLEVIKLTALFVARNGDAYLAKLINHESQLGNAAQFEFTNSSHSLHGLFRQYVDQYRKILDDNVETPEDVLTAGVARAKYELQHKTQKRNEEKKKQEKQIAYALIDWQDFHIVSTVEFDAVDEVKELAVPLKKEDLMVRSLDLRRKELELELGPAVNKPEENTTEQKDNGSQTEEGENKDALKGITGFVPKGIKIRAAGESRLKKTNKEQMIKCPITGKQVPLLKFDMHLRILVRDPRYKQEQENFMKKNFTYESNLTTDQVYENIKRLVRKNEEEDGNDRKRIKN